MSTVLEHEAAAGAAQRAGVSVVVPTFREAENLPVLVPRVAEALAEAGLDGEIVIVDDNSRDGTDEVCRRLAEEHPVRLIVRRHERGLSSAVLEGLRQSRGDVLVVMDADLSHPPEAIPRLVELVRGGGADFAIGSRYVRGGTTDDEWSFFRRLNSQAATLLARPLTSARDPMAGFFALSAKTFRTASDLNPVGYKIGLELMVKCGCRDVRETPIHFRDRLHGQSKLSLKEQINYLRHLGRLYAHRLGRIPRAVRFMLVGTSGAAVDVAALMLLLTVLSLPAARAAAIWLAMTWNYVLNRKATFPHAAPRALPVQYGLFCLSCLAGAAVNWSVTVGLCKSIAYFADRPIAAALVGVAAGFALNYLLCCSVVFRPKQSAAGH